MAPLVSRNLVHCLFFTAASLTELYSHATLQMWPLHREAEALPQCRGRFWAASPNRYSQSSASLHLEGMQRLCGAVGNTKYSFILVAKAVGFEMQDACLPQELSREENRCWKVTFLSLLRETLYGCKLFLGLETQELPASWMWGYSGYWRDANAAYANTTPGWS